MIKLEVQIPPALNQLLEKRRGEVGPVPVDAIASTLFCEFIEHAPPDVVRWMALRLQHSRNHGQNPTEPSLWAAFATRIRAEVREELAPEVNLAAAVRAVVAHKPGDGR